MGIKEIRARGGRTVLLDADVLGSLDDFATRACLLRPHGRRAGEPDRAAAVRALLALIERCPAGACPGASGQPRIYVAASSADIDLAEQVIARVRELGGEVTYDWTPDVRRLGACPSEYALARAAVEADIRGVASAECLLLVDGSPSYGRAVELGAGIMRALHDGLPLVQCGTGGDLSRGRIWETLVTSVHPGTDEAVKASISRALWYREQVRARVLQAPPRADG